MDCRAEEDEVVRLCEEPIWPLAAGPDLLGSLKAIGRQYQLLVQRVLIILKEEEQPALTGRVELKVVFLEISVSQVTLYAVNLVLRLKRNLCMNEPLRQRPLRHHNLDLTL